MKYLCLFIFLVTACNWKKSDIHNLYPLGSKLSLDHFVNGEMLIKDKNFYIIQTDLYPDLEAYEPYLLFFNIKSLKLESSIYNPGKISEIRDKQIVGYYNFNRSQPMMLQLENGYTYSFRIKEPLPRSKFEGDIEIYNIENDSIYIQTKDSQGVKVSYGLNQLVFPASGGNTMEVYNFSDRLTYIEYEMNQLKMKRDIWNYYFNK